MTNYEPRYGPVTRVLHWTVAVLVIALLWLGWYMVDISYYDAWYNKSLNWHKALGMVALVAGAVNLCWAMGTRAPAPVASMVAWERMATRAMHGMLFAMMVAIPVTGYIVSTSAGAGVGVFGWFEIPALLPANEGLRDVAITLHFYLAYITAALVLVHAGAALKHQFVDRNGVLRRML